ncbi:MAG: DUF4949 domain-containing protein [Legionella sp.]|nr:DUF4949 domain-containing protein [Legionella sp.]
MKKSLFIAGLCLGMANVTFASPLVMNKPIECPSVAAIKANTLVDKILSLPNGGWVSIFEAQKYNTDSRWVFALSNFSADSKQEAQDKSVKSLASLFYVSGPEKEEGSSTWHCQYQTSEGYWGTATQQPF